MAVLAVVAAAGVLAGACTPEGLSAGTRTSAEGLVRDLGAYVRGSRAEARVLPIDDLSKVDDLLAEFRGVDHLTSAESRLMGELDDISRALTEARGIQHQIDDVRTVVSTGAQEAIDASRTQGLTPEFELDLEKVGEGYVRSQTCAFLESNANGTEYRLPSPGDIVEGLIQGAIGQLQASWAPGLASALDWTTWARKINNLSVAVHDEMLGGDPNGALYSTPSGTRTRARVAYLRYCLAPPD
jgi:hypothetical protein